MKLFNECYSSEVQCLLNLYSLKRPFTAAEAEEYAREASVYSASGNYAALLRRWENRGLIVRLGGTYTVGPEFPAFAAPLNALETERLWDLCRVRETALFLPDDLREKLGRLLLSAGEAGMAERSACCEDESMGEAERSVSAGEGKQDRLPEAEPFRTVLDAIANGRRIGYTYRVRGEVRTAEVSPWRIEYNALDGRWWLISYWEEQERTVKSRLDRLRAVRMLEQRAVDEETIHRAILTHLAPEPVVLRIAGENPGKLRNVAERCFIGFENMLETTAVRRSDTEYELSFRYFLWDEKLIIRKLMALGEYVTIISPESMAERMAGELRSALGRYEAG